MPITIVLLMCNPTGFRNIIDLGNGHRLKRRALILLLRNLQDKAIVVKANGTGKYTVVVDIHIGQQSRGFRVLRMRLDNAPGKAIRSGVAQDKYQLKDQKQQERFNGKAVGKRG